jgi:hypothetical protein
MRPSIIAFICAALLLAAAGPVVAQQAETGPAKTGEPPLRGTETGTRGPSGGSPETGYHGPRDVTKDAEPGKAKTQEEQRRTGQVPESKTKRN